MHAARVPPLPARLFVLLLASGLALAQAPAAVDLVEAGRYAEARAQLDAAEGLPRRTQEDRDAAARAAALRERLP